MLHQIDRFWSGNSTWGWGRPEIARDWCGNIALQSARNATKWKARWEGRHLGCWCHCLLAVLWWRLSILWWRRRGEIQALNFERWAWLWCLWIAHDEVANHGLLKQGSVQKAKRKANCEHANLECAHLDSSIELDENWGWQALNALWKYELPSKALGFLHCQHLARVRRHERDAQTVHWDRRRPWRSHLKRGDAQ